MKRAPPARANRCVPVLASLYRSDADEMQRSSINSLALYSLSIPLQHVSLTREQALQKPLQPSVSDGHQRRVSRCRHHFLGTSCTPHPPSKTHNTSHHVTEFRQTELRICTILNPVLYAYRNKKTQVQSQQPVRSTVNRWLSAQQLNDGQ